MNSVPQEKLKNKAELYNWLAKVSWFYLLLFVAVYIVLNVGPQSVRTNDELRLALSNILAFFASLATSVMGWIYARRARRSSPDYYGWVLLGLAGFADSIGCLFWTYYELFAHYETPMPSWADVAYFLAAISLIAGVFVLFGALRIVGRARLLLDSAIAMTSVGALLWYLLIEQLWAQSNTTIMAKVLGTAYPMADCVALYGACALWFSTREKSPLRRSVALLVGGLASITISDSFFSYFTLHSSYHSGMWLDVGWVVGWISIANALRLQIDAAHSNAAHSNEYSNEGLCEYSFASAQEARLSVTLWRLLGPYLAAFLAIFALAFYDLQKNGAISISILGWGSTLIVLVSLRQVFAILENQQLTHQFASLLQYTNELNDVLEVEHVLRVTARYAQTLTRSSGAAVWLYARDNSSFALDSSPIAAPDFEAHSATNSETNSDAHPNTNPKMRSGVKSQVFVQSGVMPGFEQFEQIARNLQLRDSSTRVGASTPNSPNAACSLDDDGTADSGNAFSMREIVLETGPCLLVPLSHRGEEIGFVAVARAKKGFSRQQLDILKSMTLEANTAISNALSYQMAVEAVDHDFVTDLLNHRAVHDALHLEWERAVLQKWPLSVVMMDLNDFKFFNDTHGHPIGDHLLRLVARVLRETCREGDVLARYGGDEFVWLLPNTNASDARVMAQRVRKRMDGEGFRLAGSGDILPVGLSMGIATFPEDARTRNELLGVADANLYRAKLDNEPICVTREVQRSNTELRSDDSYGFLDALVTAVDNKDSYTRRHSEDVTDFALWIGEEIGLPTESLCAIRVGGLLHDVGKIGVPDEILRKPGQLTEEEFEVIKRHPTIGALIVSGVPGMHFIEDIVRYHHERWDGKGYPAGLSGEDIPLLGRITAVADAFSAMTTSRPYRRGLSWEVALAEIEKNRGTQFDPALAEVFLRKVRKKMAENQAEHDLEKIRHISEAAA